MMEGHVTMEDIARVLSPTEPAPPEVVEHLKHCDHCLSLFRGITQPQERTDIDDEDAPSCDHEAEVYNHYHGLNKLPDNAKEKLQRIYNRSKLLLHIEKCDYCKDFVQYLKVSAAPPSPITISAQEAARICFDFLGVLMGHVPQPQLSAMYMAANTDKEILFEFPLGSFHAVLSYKPQGGTLTVTRPEGEEFPGITVHADAVERLQKDQKGWDEVTTDQLICRFSTEKINLLHVAGCPVIETVPYPVLRDQRKILNMR
jgi:hypothetical protein